MVDMSLNIHLSSADTTAEYFSPEYSYLLACNTLRSEHHTLCVYLRIRLDDNAFSSLTTNQKNAW